MNGQHRHVDTASIVQQLGDEMFLRVNPLLTTPTTRNEGIDEQLVITSSKVKDSNEIPEMIQLLIICMVIEQYS